MGQCRRLRKRSGRGAGNHSADRMGGCVGISISSEYQSRTADGADGCAVALALGANPDEQPAYSSRAAAAESRTVDDFALDDVEPAGRQPNDDARQHGVPNALTSTR